MTSQTLSPSMFTPPWDPEPEPPATDDPASLDEWINADDDSLSSNIEAAEWSRPENLGTELPGVPEFDPALMPNSFRPLVEDVADRMQVPMDFPGVVAVATLAGLVNRRALIQPKSKDTSWVIVPNLWGGIIAGPGLMKSPVISSMTQPAREIESGWRAMNELAKQEYQASIEIDKLHHAVWQEGYKRAQKTGKAPPEKPAVSMVEPTAMRLLITDATFESLQKLLSENPAGLFMIRDELTGWLAGLERPGREQERAFSLECWNGDSGFTVDRIGRGTIHVEHTCISLFGGIQPGRLRAYLADALRDGPSNDGLIQRFQLLVWPDGLGQWHYVDRPPSNEAMQGAADVYRRLASMDAAHPQRFQFEAEAQEMFVDWLTGLERRLPDEVSPVMRAHLSKYRKLMPALALLFALAEGHVNLVPLHCARLAADWCDYLEQHAIRVYSSAISPERSAAMALSKRLLAGWRQEEKSFSLRDIYRNHWNGLSSREEATGAVAELELCSWVRRINRKAIQATGRPSDQFAINPRIWTSKVGERQWA